jgi:hypothetical protein
MGAVSVTRFVLVVFNVIILLIAVALCVTALVTPAWQTVFLAEFQTVHNHGLWMDCTIGRRHVQGASESLHCTYKFEYSFFDPDTVDSPIPLEEDQRKFHEWHKAVIILFAAAIVAGGSALCFTLCAPCIRICAIVANVLTLLSGFTSSVALFIFFINSHKTEIRFVHGITLTYEQSKGYSFYLAVGSVIAFFLAFIIGLLLTVSVFVHDRNQHRRKTFPKTNTSVAVAV